MTGPSNPKKFLQPFQRPELTPILGDAYQALKPFGVDYDSSMSELHQAGLRAQRQRDSAAVQAWKDLRDAEKRLMADLLFLQPDPTVFGEETEEDYCVTVPPPPPAPLPEIGPASAETVLQAIGPLPVPPAPQPVPVGDSPPIEPDLWALLDEAWEPDQAALPPLPEPSSFLEDD